ncbi:MULTISPECIES: erythromycin esterase family protein [Streptomyces]|uniref:Erythromycin esterase family protein n=2 Tax=Streptomyces TaxID=1883 RepID=A0A3R7I0P7_9ACTN|nr:MULTISPECIES: erythromycin esterase family protein [Streptomyces]KNE83023.1 erythromycin esterase [Streptomyces fradiae]OFA52866.1 erythromycin esterase [Streptomyces fradiae]PQM20515.1 erythromycin esterase [Streptomyces xinghaiensis]RKM91324.1 erythromycin esterase family protein [Streptomyces xinghaiensis]RNC69818.1 erythromycin esterase family protein [Streptomyces xinghaiensis]
MTSRRIRTAGLVPAAVLLSLGALVSAAPAQGAPAAPQTVSAQQSLSAQEGTFARSSASRSGEERRVLRALERAARPLRSTEPYGSSRDLRPLSRMVGDARVVGLGEATHGSHEFFSMKHRVFRHLVEEKGFRTFSLEAPWGTGMRLNDYVLHGKGDPRQIMDEEFQGVYRIMSKAEYLELFSWMRAHNRSHPHDPVRFMGNDMGHVGPELYDRVTDYVAEAHPRLLPRVTELYQGLRPTTSAGTWMTDYPSLPLTERQERAERTGKVLDLLEKLPAGSGADRRDHLWAVQHARAVDQMTRGYAFDVEDSEQITAMMKYRDRVMADNVAWWQTHTGDKILLSAHNTHVAYDSFDVFYPKTQGAVLKDRFGRGYVSIGFTFDRGSFQGFGSEEGPTSPEQTFTVGAARPGGNEHLLDRVRHRDYIVDLRTAPAPARAWLAEARPTRNIGAAWPVPEQDIALGEAHDVLIHLHRVTAAKPLPAS